MQLDAVEHLGELAAFAPAPLLRVIDGRPNRFAVDLTPPYLLIFEPAHDPVPLTADLEIDLQRVTAIRVLAVDGSSALTQRVA